MKNRALKTQRREINTTYTPQMKHLWLIKVYFALPSSVLSLKEPDRLMARGRSSREFALPPSG